MGSKMKTVFKTSIAIAILGAAEQRSQLVGFDPVREIDGAAVRLG
jgi:hypothetical protein